MSPHKCGDIKIAKIPYEGAYPLARLSKKYYFFDKEVCGLTAAHAPSA